MKRLVILFHRSLFTQIATPSFKFRNSEHNVKVVILGDGRS